MERTIEGVKYTLRAAKKEGWYDYGLQAQADVEFLLREIERLRRVVTAQEALSE